MLFDCTIDFIKLKLSNHWSNRNITHLVSLKHIFRAVVWRQFNHICTTWTTCMLSSQADINIQSPSSLATHLHHIQHLLHHNNLTKNRFTPQVGADFDLKHTFRNVIPTSKTPRDCHSLTTTPSQALKGKPSISAHTTTRNSISTQSLNGPRSTEHI